MDKHYAMTADLALLPNARAVLPTKRDAGNPPPAGISTQVGSSATKRLLESFIAIGNPKTRCV